MLKIGWVKIAVAASVVVSGALVAAPGASAAAPPPPPVINMSIVPANDAGAVQQFENNAVSEVLTDHDLPSSDANAVLAWGRDDVRAQEWSDLDQIMSEPAASRSANDQLVYDWFQGVDQQQQVAAAQDAINEYLKWSGHTSISDGSEPQNFGPGGTGYCNYEPPGGESGPFGGTYNDNQDQDCYTPCTDFVTDCTPGYPSVDQFQQWGLYDADEAQTNTPDYYSTMVGTSVSMGIGLTAALGSLALPFGTAIDASALSGTAIQEALFPFAARVGVWVAQAARLGLTSAELASDVAPEVAAGAEVAGAVAFVAGVAIFAIVSIVLASITLAQNAAVHTDLADALTQAQDNAPDLASQVGTSAGYTALYSTFVEQTLPEADLSCTSQFVESPPCANAPAPPAPGSSDPSFLVTANGTTTLQRSIYSVDPGGFFDNTYLSGNGWFVTQKFDPTDTANATSPTDPGATVQSLSFPYTDWAGNNYFAERVTVGGQPMFAITPVDSSNSSACAIPPGATATPCLTTSIQFTEPNGTGTPIDATAELEPASASAPTAAASYPAPAQVGQPVSLTANGSDPNNLPLTYTWKLPEQWNGSSISCPGSGPCDATLTGASPSYTFTLPGVYQGTLTVADSAGYSSTENFAITVTDKTITGISSSANPSAYGQPVTLTADVTPSLVGSNGAYQYPAVTGYVQFTLNDNPLGQPVALQPTPGCGSPCDVPDGVATLTLPGFPVTPAGLHGQDITARYLGSNDYAASSDFLNPNGQVVDQASTTTTASSSADPSVAGQPITFSASVAPVSPGAGLPTGKVQFQYNGANVGGPVTLSSTGTATSPPVTLAHADQGGFVLIGGNVSAVYSGDGNFAGSSDTSLDQGVRTDPTTTAVTSSANPSSEGQPVTFTATVTANAPGSGTPAGQVQFNIDGTAVGSPVNLDATGTATLTTDATDSLALTGFGTSFPSGHVVTAQYLGVPCNGCIFYIPDFGQSTGTLAGGQSVNQSTLVITASSPMVTYGDPVPAISPGYSGFVGSDTAASLATAPSCATTYQQGNVAGTYPATCQGAVDPAYQLLYAAGTVTVQPATLTVTAKNESMTAGGTVPAYAFAYSGFIGSDGPSALTAVPSCRAVDPATGNPVSSATAAGTYPITCSGGAAANYSFTYVPGTLTIGRNTTSLVYSGSQTLLTGASFSPQVTVSGPAVCSSGQAVSFALSSNPLTGAKTSYPVGSGTSASGLAGVVVPTSGWLPGVYTVTGVSQPDGGCAGATVSATVTIGTAGAGAAGSGTYSVPGTGKVTFTLAAGPVPHSGSHAYVGVADIGSSQWNLVGTISQYATTAGAGSVTGKGLLYWWNTSLNKGKGGWQLVKSGVVFTASFSSTVKGKNGSPGSFGVNIVYSPVAPQGALPDSAPLALTSGTVKAS